MKLLRLHSNTTDGNFSTTFREDIVIQPKAEIALSNCSFTSEDQKFTINSTNNIIQFQLTATEGLLQIELPFQTVDNDNLEEFFQTITKLMNDELLFSGKRIGGQFRVAIGDKDFNRVEDEGVVNFVYQRALFYDGLNFDDADNGTNKSIEILHFVNALKIDDPNFDNNYIRRFNSTGNDTIHLNQNFISSRVPLCSGAGTFRFGLDTLIYNNDGLNEGFETDNNGVALCLLNKNPAQDPNFDISNVVLGIYAGRAGSPYRTIVNGVETSHAGFNVNIPIPNNTDNDVLEIRRSEGKYFLKVSRKNGATHNFGTHTIFTDNTELYPVVIFKGEGTNAKIMNLRLTVDPYRIKFYEIRDINYVIQAYQGNDIFRNEEGDLPETYTLNQLPNTGTNPITYNPATFRLNTSFKLIFGSVGLSEYLGFEGIRIFDFNGSCAIFKGFEPFWTIRLLNNYVVELLNIEIESFDSLHEGRRNLLKVIPVPNVNNSTVNYEASNLVFLNVRNAFPKTLRNIKARILDDNLQPVNTTENSVITILIK